FNSILPARVGEVVRCVHIGRREKIGVATAFATVVAERILDAVTLLVLLAVSFAILPEIPEDFSASVMGFELSATRLNESIVKLVWLSGFLSACVVIFMLPFVQLIAIRLARAWLPG